MKKHIVKFISDFLPLIAFFLAYKMYGIIAATGTIVVTSVFGLAVSYIFHKKVSAMHLFTVIILVIFGGITVLSKNPMFIKLKPTILNLCFAGVLIFGLLNKKSYLKTLLGDALPLSDKGWLILTKRFILFFIAVAISNEFVWRSFSEDTWIYFKSFGLLPLSIIFMLMQIPLFLKHKS